MGTVVDLTGKTIEVSPKKPRIDFSSKDIQEIVDHLAWLNQEGQCAGLIVGIIHTDGHKTKAYALDYDTDPDSISGFLERIKDLIKADLVKK